MLSTLARVFEFPVESYKNDRGLLPNKISYVRMGLFWLPTALLVWNPESEALRWAAALSFLVIAATDGIDGWIARKYDMRSALGEWLDPVADKLLVLTTLIALLVVNLGNPAAFSLYVLFWVSFLREVTVPVGIYAVQRRRMLPTFIGKVKMMAQCVAVGIWLVPTAWDWVAPVRDALTWVVVAIVVVSWVEYLVKFVFNGRIQTPAI